KISLNHWRAYLQGGGLAGSVPQHLHAHLADLMANAPDSREAAKAKTSAEILANVNGLADGSIDATTQAKEWAKDNQERLARQPLSRELRQALGNWGYRRY